MDDQNGQTFYIAESIVEQMNQLYLELECRLMCLLDA